MNDAPGGEVLVYEAPDGGVRVDVRLDQETVWLTQRQMAELFETTPENVTIHLGNVFANKELAESATTKEFLVVQTEGRRRVRRQVKHYNLDAIISVGYRVNSRRGIRFRQWATTILREHLVRGYTLNHQRFEENARELESALALVRKAASGEALTSDEGRGLVDIIARYTQTFLLLHRYDQGSLVEPRGVPGGTLPTVGEARRAIGELKADLVGRGEASELFGHERAEGLRRCSVTSIRPYSASPPTRRSRRRPRTCSISSSRIIPSRTGTSGSGRSCSSSSCIAMDDSLAVASRSSMTSDSRHSRCSSPSLRRRTRR